jgi:hypothetical protein
MPPDPEDVGSDSAGAGHHFASADYQTLYRQFGITAAALAAAAWEQRPRRPERHPARRPHPVTFAPAAGGTAGRPA